MLGYVLLFVFVFAIVSLAVFAMSAYRRSREERRQQQRLNSAFNRAQHSRKHGFPPIFAASAMLSERSLWPDEVR